MTIYYLFLNELTGWERTSAYIAGQKNRLEGDIDIITGNEIYKNVIHRFSGMYYKIFPHKVINYPYIMLITDSEVNTIENFIDGMEKYNNYNGKPTYYHYNTYKEVEEFYNQYKGNRNAFQNDFRTRLLNIFENKI